MFSFFCVAYLLFLSDRRTGNIGGMRSGNDASWTRTCHLYKRKRVQLVRACSLASMIYVSTPMLFSYLLSLWLDSHRPKQSVLNTTTTNYDSEIIFPSNYFMFLLPNWYTFKLNWQECQ